MLTSIDVDSENSFALPVLGVTPKDSLLVRQITGLNPPDLNLFIGDYSRDGGIYQGRRVGTRNIVLTMDLNPNPALGETISSLRENLYKAFVDPLVEADYLKIGLNLDDGRTLYLVGYTEKFETEIFSVDTLAQISIICPDPYIRAENPEILTHPSGWITVPFHYQGTAETGFETEIHINTATPTLTLANNAVGDATAPDYDDLNYYKGRMVIHHDFAVGDVVTINTVRGHRKIIVEPAGGAPAQSLIASLSPKSPWIELHSQSNTMTVYGINSTQLPASIRSLIYVPAYWGI